MPNRATRLATLTTAEAADPLERIAAAQELMDEARVLLVDAVDAARADRRTWTEIGDALGVSRQGAYNRFGESDR